MKVRKIIVGLLIFILLLVPGCLNDGDQGDQKQQTVKIVYELSISSNRTINSSILLPVPTYNNETIDFDYSNNSLSNESANLSIVETGYGDCLKIDINRSNRVDFRSVISWNETVGKYPKYKLSTADGELSNHVEYYTWIKNEGTDNVTLKLKFHRKLAGYGHMIGTTIHSDKVTLTPGWQKIIVDNRIPIID